MTLNEADNACEPVVEDSAEVTLALEDGRELLGYVTKASGSPITNTLSVMVPSEPRETWLQVTEYTRTGEVDAEYKDDNGSLPAGVEPSDITAVEEAGA